MAAITTVSILSCLVVRRPVSVERATIDSELARYHAAGWQVAWERNDLASDVFVLWQPKPLH